MVTMYFREYKCFAIINIFLFVIRQMIFLTPQKIKTVKSSFMIYLNLFFLFSGETGLFPEAYVEETFESDAPPAIAPPPLPQVSY